ncbi:hypothetical protein [Metaplanococcus flavidus]|uniref:YokE-like PH domain-containing protein n=1 Tax=Metaplanococcus flavidus TaxID=569883 RepID=A0ABW3LFD1_9BACL
MAHPTKLLKELEESMSNASITHWIFGIFRTSRSDLVDGFKGLLAVNEESLFFKSGGSNEESRLIEVPIREVEGLEAELDGTVKMNILLIDGDYLEMSYISRGNTKEFIRFLKIHCKNLKDEALLTEKTER